MAFRIYRPRRLLFDHLPKCGGTATYHFLASHYPARYVFQTDGEYPLKSVEQFQGMAQSDRWNYHLVCGHVAHKLIEFSHPDIVVLTILREPIDRLVSQCYFTKQNKRHHDHAQLQDRKMGLEEYAKKGPGWSWRNFYTCHFAGLNAGEVDKDPEGALEKAKAKLSERYDYIGFQDNMVAVMGQLASTAGLRRTYTGDIRNRTLDRPKVDQLPEQIRKTLTEINSLDVRLYRWLRAGRPKGETISNS